MWEIVLITFGTLLGAATVRITGLGFALIATPFYIVAVGPSDTVAIVIVLAAVNGLMIMWAMRSQIEYRRVLWIMLGGLVGALPGTWILHTAPQRVLELTIGILVIVTLVVTVRIPVGRTLDGWKARSIVGFFWGFLNALAALGAPPLTIYARLTGWEVSRFAASVQPMFVLSAPLFLGLRASMSGEWFPSFGLPTILAVMIALIVGVFLGGYVTRWVSPRLALRLQAGLSLGAALFISIRAVVLWGE